MASTQQGANLSCRVSLCAGPAGKHESNLVDEVSDVVCDVECIVTHAPKQVAEQVAKRVDGPAECDDQAHVLERSRDSLAALPSHATSFTSKDLSQDEEPATHATHETNPWV